MFFVHQFRNFSNCFHILSSWWLPIPWIIFRTYCCFLNTLNHSKICIQERASFHEQFQAFCVFLWLFSQVWNKTLYLLAAPWQKETIELRGRAATMNWTFFSLPQAVITWNNINWLQTVYVPNYTSAIASIPKCHWSTSCTVFYYLLCLPELLAMI